jgi:hypothetical protein
MPDERQPQWNEQPTTESIHHRRLMNTLPTSVLAQLRITVACFFHPFACPNFEHAPALRPYPRPHISLLLLLPLLFLLRFGWSRGGGRHLLRRRRLGRLCRPQPQQLGHRITLHKSTHAIHERATSSYCPSFSMKLATCTTG